MTTQLPTQPARDDLADEVCRYLTAVEAFRAAGYEPRWQSEAQGGKNDD